VSRIEIRVDDDLKLEAEAYAAVKGYGRASNLARVALVALMSRNRLTKAQRVRFEEVYGKLRQEGYAVVRKASGDNPSEVPDATGRPI
jgi:hypothetical protein